MNRHFSLKAVSILVSLALVWTGGNVAQAAALAPEVFAAPSKLPQFQLIPPAALGRVVDYFNAAPDHPVGAGLVPARNPVTRNPVTRNSMTHHSMTGHPIEWRAGTRPAPTMPLVILIQDLHAHYGVQKNIAGLLDFLSQILPAPTPPNPDTPTRPLPFALAVEGASGAVDSSVMALFPDKKIKLAASDYLMRQGELTGAEYFAIKRGLPHLLVGAENKAYYLKHRELFRKTLADRDELVKTLKDIQQGLQALPRFVFRKNKPLWEFQKNVEAYDKGEMSMHDFVGLLVSECRGIGVSESRHEVTPILRYPDTPIRPINLSRDFPALASFDANSRFGTMAQIRAATADFLAHSESRLSGEEKSGLKLLAKNKSVTPYYLYLRELVYKNQLFLAVPPELAQYMEYLHTVQTMGMDRVTHEARELAFRIKLNLAREGSSARDLIQVQHDLDLLLNLADLQANEFEVRDFAPRFNQFVALTRSLVARSGPASDVEHPGPRTSDVERSFDDARLRHLISSSIDFYLLALMRNRPMVDNTLALIDEQPNGGRQKGRLTGTAADGNGGDRNSLNKATTLRRFRQPTLPLAAVPVSRPSTAVLVAGGFHTIQMTHILREKNIRYIVLCPMVDKLSDQDHALYVKRLNGEFLTTEEIMADRRRLPDPDQGRTWLAFLKNPLVSEAQASTDRKTLAIGAIGIGTILAMHFLDAAFAQHLASIHQTAGQALQSFAAHLNQVAGLTAQGHQVIAAWMTHIQTLAGPHKDAAAAVNHGNLWAFLPLLGNPRMLAHLLERARRWFGGRTSPAEPEAAPTLPPPSPLPQIPLLKRETRSISALPPKAPDTTLSWNDFAKQSGVHPEAIANILGDFPSLKEAGVPPTFEDFKLRIQADPAVQNELTGYLQAKPVSKKLISDLFAVSRPYADLRFLKMDWLKDVKLNAFNTAESISAIASPETLWKGLEKENRIPVPSLKLADEFISINPDVLKKLNLSLAELKAADHKPFKMSQAAEPKLPSFAEPFISRLQSYRIPTNLIASLYRGASKWIPPQFKSWLLQRLPLTRAAIGYAKGKPKGYSGLLAAAAALGFVLVIMALFGGLTVVGALQMIAAPVVIAYVGYRQIARLYNRGAMPGFESVPPASVKVALGIVTAGTALGLVIAAGHLTLTAAALTAIPFALAGLLYFIGARRLNAGLEAVERGEGLVTREPSRYRIAERMRVATKIRQILGLELAAQTSPVIVEGIRQVTESQFERLAAAFEDPRAAIEAFRRGHYFDDQPHAGGTAASRVLYVNPRAPREGVGSDLRWQALDQTLVGLAYVTIGADGQNTMYIHQHLARAPEAILDRLLKNTIGGVRFYQSRFPALFGKHAARMAQLTGNLFEVFLSFAPTYLASVLKESIFSVSNASRFAFRILRAVQFYLLPNEDLFVFVGAKTWTAPTWLKFLYDLIRATPMLDVADINPIEIINGANFGIRLALMYAADRLKTSAAALRDFAVRLLDHLTPSLNYLIKLSLHDSRTMPGSPGLIGRYELGSVKVTATDRPEMVRVTARVKHLDNAEDSQELQLSGIKRTKARLLEAVERSPEFKKAYDANPAARKIMTWFLNDFNGDVIELDAGDSEVYGVGGKHWIMLAEELIEDPMAIFHEVGHAAIEAGAITADEIISGLPETIRGSVLWKLKSNPSIKDHEALRGLQLHLAPSLDQVLSRRIQRKRIQTSLRLAQQSPTEEAERSLAAALESSEVYLNRKSLEMPAGVLRADLNDLIHMAQLWLRMDQENAEGDSERIHVFSNIFLFSQRPEVLPLFRARHDDFMRMGALSDWYVHSLSELNREQNLEFLADSPLLQPDMAQLAADIADRLKDLDFDKAKRAFIALMDIASRQGGFRRDVNAVKALLQHRETLLHLDPAVLAIYLIHVDNYRESFLDPFEKDTDYVNILTDARVLESIQGMGVNDATIRLRLLSIHEDAMAIFQDPSRLASFAQLPEDLQLSLSLQLYKSRGPYPTEFLSSKALRTLLGDAALHLYRAHGASIDPLIQVLKKFPEDLPLYQDPAGPAIQQWLSLNELGLAGDYTKLLLGLKDRRALLQPPAIVDLLIRAGRSDAAVVKEILNSAAKNFPERAGVLLSPEMIRQLSAMTPEVRQAYLSAQGEDTIKKDPSRWFDPRVAEAAASLQSATLLGDFTNQIYQGPLGGILFDDSLRAKLVAGLKSSASVAHQRALIREADGNMLQHQSLINAIRSAVKDNDLQQDLLAGLKNPQFLSFLSQGTAGTGLDFIVKLSALSINRASAFVSLAAKSKWSLQDYQDVIQRYGQGFIDQPDYYTAALMELLAAYPGQIHQLPMGSLNQLNTLSPVLFEDYVRRVVYQPELLSNADLRNYLLELAAADQKNGVSAPIPYAGEYRASQRVRAHGMLFVRTPATNPHPYGYQFGQGILRAVTDLRYHKTELTLEDILGFVKNNQHGIAALHAELLDQWFQSLVLLGTHTMQTEVLTALGRLSKYETGVFILEQMRVFQWNMNRAREEAGAEQKVADIQQALTRLENWLKDPRTAPVLNAASSNRLAWIETWLDAQRKEGRARKLDLELLGLENFWQLPCSDGALKELTKELSKEWPAELVAELLSPAAKEFFDRVAHTFGPAMVDAILLLMQRKETEAGPFLRSLMENPKLLTEVGQNIHMFFGAHGRFDRLQNANADALELLLIPPETLRTAHDRLSEWLGANEIATQLELGNFQKVIAWIDLLSSIEKDGMSGFLAHQMTATRPALRVSFLQALIQWGAHRMLILALPLQQAQPWLDNPRALTLLSQKLMSLISLLGRESRQHAIELVKTILSIGRRDHVNELETFTHALGINRDLAVQKDLTTFISATSLLKGKSFGSRLEALKILGELLNTRAGIKSIKELNSYGAEIGTLVQATLAGGKVDIAALRAAQEGIQRRLLTEVTGVSTILPALAKDPSIMERMMVLISLYYSLASHSTTAHSSREQMRQYIQEMLQDYLKTGDENRLRQRVLGLKANQEERAHLIQAGYDPALLDRGFSVTVDVSPVTEGNRIYSARRVIEQRSHELIDLALQANYRPEDMTPEQLADLRFDNFEAAQEFVAKMRERVPGASQLARAADILSDIRTIEQEARQPTSQAAGSEPVTIVVSKDFLDEASAGWAAWAGCFNTNGIHREMPAAHAMEGNAMFARAYDAAGRPIANVVLALTDQGVVVYGSYSSRPDLNLDEAWFEAWKVLAQMAPAVILRSDVKATAGLETAYQEAKEGRMAAASAVKAAVKRPTLWGPMYYDFGKNLPDGGVQYDFVSAFIVTRKDYPDVKVSYLHEEEKTPASPSESVPEAPLLRKMERGALQKELFDLKLFKVEMSPVLSALDEIVLQDTQAKLEERVNALMTRGRKPQPAVSEDKAKLLSALTAIRARYSDPNALNEFRIRQGFQAMPKQIESWIKSHQGQEEAGAEKPAKRIPTQAEVFSLLHETLTEGMGADLNIPTHPKTHSSEEPLRLTQNELIRLDFSLTGIADRVSQSPRAPERSLTEQLFGEYIPKAEEIVLHGQLVVQGTELHLDLISNEDNLPVLNQNTLPDGQTILQFELYVRGGQLRLEIVDAVSKGAVSPTKAYRTLEAMAQHIANTAGSPVTLESETALFRARARWDAKKGEYEWSNRNRDASAEVGWSLDRQAQNLVKQLWINDLHPWLSQKGIHADDFRTRGIDQRNFRYYQKTVAPHRPEPIEDPAQFPIWAVANHADKEFKNYRGGTPAGIIYLGMRVLQAFGMTIDDRTVSRVGWLAAKVEIALLTVLAAILGHAVFLPFMLGFMMLHALSIGLLIAFDSRRPAVQVKDIVTQQILLYLYTVLPLPLLLALAGIHFYFDQFQIMGAAAPRSESKSWLFNRRTFIGVALAFIVGWLVYQAIDLWNKLTGRATPEARPVSPSHKKPVPPVQAPGRTGFAIGVGLGYVVPNQTEQAASAWVKTVLDGISPIADTIAGQISDETGKTNVPIEIAVPPAYNKFETEQLRAFQQTFDELKPEERDRARALLKDHQRELNSERRAAEKKALKGSAHRPSFALGNHAVLYHREITVLAQRVGLVSIVLASPGISSVNAQPQATLAAKSDPQATSRTLGEALISLSAIAYLGLNLLSANTLQTLGRMAHATIDPVVAPLLTVVLAAGVLWYSRPLWKGFWKALQNTPGRQRARALALLTHIRTRYLDRSGTSEFTSVLNLDDPAAQTATRSVFSLAA